MDNEAEIRKLAGDRELNPEQQAEIRDILLSARTVSRQMVSQAREQSDEILRTARDRAEQIIQDAEEKAAAIVAGAERRAADAVPSEAAAQMQEYAVSCVGECFSRLRKQQLETVDYINEQWRSFLGGLTLTEDTPYVQKLPAETVNQQDIETRVNAIARELMEIIGK